MIKLKMFPAAIRLAILCSLMWMARPANAFNYTNMDLMLVFHLDASRNDIEFNLGSISNYLGRTSGTVITVTNWDRNLVLNNYDGDLNGVLVTLLSTTTIDAAVPRTWITVSSTGTPTDMSGSKLSTLRSKIDGIGQKAAASTYYSLPNSFVISPNEPASYTAQASDSFTTPVETMGGRTPGTTSNPLSSVTIEGAIPTTLRFFELHVANINPKPAATQVGSFALSADGTLTFTAGGDVVVAPPPHPQIKGIARQGTTATISFTTTNSASYRLVYSTDVLGSVTNWTSIGSTVSGNGGTMSLQDTASSPTRFYGVQATR